MTHLPLKLSAVPLLLLLASPAPAAEPPAARQEKERAISALETAIKADPNNAELWIHLAFANRKLDRIDRAQEAFEKAVALSPGNQDALYMLGLIYEKKEMKAEALKTWKQYLAVSTNPEKKTVAEKHIHHLSQ